AGDICTFHIVVLKDGVPNHYVYSCGESSYLTCRVRMAVMLGYDDHLWLLATRDSNGYIDLLRLNPVSMAVVDFDPDWRDVSRGLTDTNGLMLVNGEWPGVAGYGRYIVSGSQQHQPTCDSFDTCPTVFKVGINDFSTLVLPVDIQRQYPVYV